nr:hypothetical protein [uncultured Mediterraneibacter sp.]
MRLTERTDSLCTKNFRDKNKNLWKYIPVKQAADKKITPQDIAGDAGCGAKKKPVGTLTGEEGGKEKKLDVLPFRAKLGYSQKEAGYIPCEDEEGALRYVRVIRRSIAKILIPILILLVLIGGGTWWYMSRQGMPELDKSAIAYQMPDGMKNEDPSQILMPGFSTITMDEGGTTVHAALANPEGNPCYFKYFISLSDTGEQIYESGWIEPGMAVTEWDISEELPAGEYPIYILVQTGSLENYEEGMNQGAANATLVVR